MLPRYLYPVFFDFVRAGLWGESFKNKTLDIKPDDWHYIYKESVAQTVSGLVYEGIQNTNPKSLPDDELLAKWTVRTVRIINYNEKINKTISSIALSLNSKGIAPVLLKGQANALQYKNGTLRESGDIDFFFQNKEELKEAIEIVGKGFNVERKNDGSFICKRNGVIVELHSKIVDMVRPPQKDYFSKALSHNAFQRIDWVDNPEAEILMPRPVVNLLMQNLHILRHSLCFGIGLRQFCDYAVCYNKLEYKDREVIDSILVHMGLRKWNSMLLSYLGTYLGLAIAKKNSDPEPLFNIVMENGNFGFKLDSLGSRSWKRVINNNLQLFSTAPYQSLTTLFCLLKRK